MEYPAPELLENPQIPVDLFVSKKHPGLPRGVRGFADASGKIVYRVNAGLRKSSPDKKVLVDAASGSALISLYRNEGGSWKGIKGEDADEKNLVFRAQRTLNTFTRREFNIYLVGENWEDSTSTYKLKGCPYQRSCTIYKGDAIIAQTSLMYKLHQIFVKRNKFRLTIFPGFVDHALIVALVVMFLDGRK